MQHMSFIDIEIFNQFVPMLNVVLYDLDLNFQDKKFEMLASQKRWELANNW